MEAFIHPLRTGMPPPCCQLRWVAQGRHLELPRAVVSPAMHPAVIQGAGVHITGDYLSGISQRHYFRYYRLPKAVITPAVHSNIIYGAAVHATGGHLYRIG